MSELQFGAKYKPCVASYVETQPLMIGSADAIIDCNTPL